MEKYFLEEMTWPEVEAALAKGWDTVVVMVGSMEQHGPHLPLATDSLIAEAVGHRVVQKLGKALLAPIITVGDSHHHMAFPGTVTLRESTLLRVVEDCCESLAAHGFRNLVVISTHGGNFAPLEKLRASLGPKLESEGKRLVTYTDLLAFIAVTHQSAARHDVSAEASGAHAGEWETSVIRHLAGRLVNMARAEAGWVGLLGKAESEKIFREGMKALTQNGILGDPRTATPDRGGSYLDDIADHLVGFIRQHVSSS